MPNHNLLREGADSIQWSCCRFRMPSMEIAYMTAVLEGYDNQFILRSDEPRAGQVRVWCHESAVPLLENLLTEFRTQFPLEDVEYIPGMAGLDDIYPDET